MRFDAERSGQRIRIDSYGPAHAYRMERIPGGVRIEAPGSAISESRAVCTNSTFFVDITSARKNDAAVTVRHFLAWESSEPRFELSGSRRDEDGGDRLALPAVRGRYAGHAGRTALERPLRDARGRRLAAADRDASRRRTVLYNRCVFEAPEKKRGSGEAVLFARSGAAGSRKFPCSWAGDPSGNYASMAETLRGGLSYAMSGFAFWSHDIAGFFNGCSADLYKRWVQFGFLSSHTRTHWAWDYKAPWKFDEESVDVLRCFDELKCSLMPMIRKNRHISRRFTPPVRRSLRLPIRLPDYNHDGSGMVMLQEMVM